MICYAAVSPARTRCDTHLLRRAEPAAVHPPILVLVRERIRVLARRKVARRVPLVVVRVLAVVLDRHSALLAFGRARRCRRGRRLRALGRHELVRGRRDVPGLALERRGRDIGRSEQFRDVHGAGCAALSGCLDTRLAEARRRNTQRTEAIGVAGSATHDAGAEKKI